MRADTPRSPSHGARGTLPRTRPKLLQMAAIGSMVLATCLLASIAAFAQQPLTMDVRVTSGTSGGSDTIALDTMTYAEAETAFTATGRTNATLPVAPTGHPQVDTAGAVVHFLPGAAPSLAIRGATTVFGVPAEILVSATWTDSADNAPEVAVLFNTGAVGMGDLVGFDTFPLPMTHSLIGSARTAHTVDPAELPPAVATFFDDGTGLNQSFPVATGVAFRGLIDSADTVLADAGAQIGLDSRVRLDGLLAADPAALAGGDPVGLDLTATLPVSGGGALPDFMRLADPWTLHLAAAGDGSVAVDFTGSAAFDVGDTQFTQVTTSVGIAYSGGAATFSLSAALGPVNDLLDQQWLDLNSVNLDASLSTADGFSGGITAQLNLQGLLNQPAVADIAFALEAGSGGASGSFDLTTNAVISVAQLASGLGATDAPSAEADLTLDRFGLSLAFASGGDVTVAVTSNVTVTIGQATFASDVLVRVGASGGAPQFLLAMRPDVDAPAQSLAKLMDAELPSEVDLPDFTLAVTNTGWDIAADDLDAATALYLGDGVDLELEQGVTIRADVELPDKDMRDAVGEVGLTPVGDLTLEGRIGILGGFETSLAVKFPEIVGGPDEPFQSGDIELKITVGVSGVEFRLAGTATVAVPRTEDPTCDESYAGACTDLLKFSLAAAFAAGPDGISFTLEGGLLSDGWHSPFGLTDVTVYQLHLEVGVEVSGGTPKLTIGMGGRVTIKDVDLTVAFALGVSPVPPFIDPKGFTFASQSGFDLANIAALVEAVTPGEELPDDLDLPDTLRLEDVFVAFGKVNDPDLCLRTGFYITAELHIGGEPRVQGEEPNCEPPPIYPPEASAQCLDSTSCLASVLIEVDDGLDSGDPGIRASGVLNKADIGPFHIDPTILELELSASSQRLFFSAGGRVDDIFNPGQTWADMSILLDLTPTNLVVEAHARIRDGQHLGVRLRGAAAFDLDNPQFELEVDLNADLLGAIANEIGPEALEFIEALQDFAEIHANDEIHIWRNLYNLLVERGDTPEWALELVGVLADVEENVRKVNKWFTDRDLPPLIPLPEILDLVLTGINVTDDGLPAIDVWADDDPSNDDLGVDGCINFQGRNADGLCFFIPPFEISTPGICDIEGFKELADGDVGRVLCNGQPLDPEQLIEVIFEEEVLAPAGITLPPGVSPAVLFTDIAPLLDGNHVYATCGYATMNYATGEVSEPEITLNVGGAQMVVGVPLDIFRDTEGDVLPDGLILNEIIAELTGNGDVTTGACQEDSVASFQPVVGDVATLRFESPHPPTQYNVTFAEVDAGEPVTALVSCTRGDVPTRVNWGDGSSTEVVDLNGGNDFYDNFLIDRTELVSHVYAGGSGRTTTYEPRVTCGSGSEVGRVIVHNRAPIVTGASFDGARIDEGQTATLTVTFTDGVEDTHRLVIDWADGFREEIAVPAPGAGGGEERTVTVVRPVPDDNPTGAPTGTESARLHVQDIGGDASDPVDVSIVVDNVTPSLLSLTPVPPAGQPFAQEGDSVLWELRVSDPGVADPITAEVRWPDGVVETVLIPGGEAVQRSVSLLHTFVDDDPTGTPVDDIPVSVTLTDDDTGTTTGDVAATVHNAPPQLLDVTVTPEVNDENASDVTVEVTFIDPGLADSHTVTIDWGDGWTDDIPVGADATTADATTTVIDVPADADASTPTAHTVTASNRYGDDGTFLIGVTVTDDDTGEVTARRLISVDNVDPTQVINAREDGAITAPSGDAYLVLAGTEGAVSATATDPGSDDLRFSWTVGDGTPLVTDFFANGVGTDPDPSPQVGPREVTDSAVLAYGESCLYGISLTVSDDDGGASQVGHAAAVVQRLRPDHHEADHEGDDDEDGHVHYDHDRHQPLKYNQWRNEIRQGDIPADVVHCYVDIAGYLSSVLIGHSEVDGAAFAPTVGVVDATPLDEDGVPVVLTQKYPNGSTKLEKEQINFDRVLLATWMNFADGVYQWDTVVDEETGQTFGEFVAEMEHIRLTTTDYRDLQDAQKQLRDLRKL